MPVRLGRARVEDLMVIAHGVASMGIDCEIVVDTKLNTALAKRNEKYNEDCALKRIGEPLKVPKTK